MIARLSQPDMMTSGGVRTRSSNSKQFVENGIRAYQNGLVWLHRNRILAEGAERYGFFEFAAEVDTRTDLVEAELGKIECFGISKDGRTTYLYKENGQPAACKPMCWTINGTLARSA